MSHGRLPLFPPGCMGGNTLRVPLFDGRECARPREECQRVRICNPACPEEIAECETATAAAESLQKETGDDGFTLEQVLGDWSQEEKLIEYVALREAMEKLSEKEQMVLKLRFYRGMTQSAAAKVLQVSQVQVSRLERKAVQDLRRQLE